MASNRNQQSVGSRGGNPQSGDTGGHPQAGNTRGNPPSGNTGPNRAAVDPNEQAARVRDDGRRDADLDQDDDRTDQRMAAKRDVNRQASQANEQDGGQIEQGSHAREGTGRARQTDGS